VSNCRSTRGQGETIQALATSSDRVVVPSTCRTSFFAELPGREAALGRGWETCERDASDYELPLSPTQHVPSNRAS
jgi:hypothetical protein